MTPLAVIVEVLARIGANSGEAVYIRADELKQWPETAVGNLKSQRLLRKARPANSVVCPGCERECSMPVHTRRTATEGHVLFVVCDKRADINRVRVSDNQLVRWRCDVDAVCDFIATELRLSRANTARSAELWHIGMASGARRSQMLCLRARGFLELIAGDVSAPLSELLVYRDGAYSIDSVGIRQIVDSSRTGDPRYTPTQAKREARKLETRSRRESWRKAYRALKRRHPGMSDVWYAREISKRDGSGRKADTIRKHMKP
jgi:hypothetical protein